jgi:hypothetical protein
MLCVLLLYILGLFLELILTKPQKIIFAFWGQAGVALLAWRVMKICIHHFFAWHCICIGVLGWEEGRGRGNSI